MFGNPVRIEGPKYQLLRQRLLSEYPNIDEETLADTLGAFPLEHPACWTCHVYGVSCRT